MRTYEEVLQGRQLLESSTKARAFALHLALVGVIFSLLILIAMAMINSWTMGRAITDRVDRLREGASVIGSGNLDYRINIKGDDEFAELSGAFDAMCAKLSRSYHDLENETNERRRAEQALHKVNDELERRVLERTDELRASEAKYRRIVDTASEGIWGIGPDTKTVFVNNRICL